MLIMLIFDSLLLVLCEKTVIINKALCIITEKADCLQRLSEKYINICDYIDFYQLMINFFNKQKGTGRAVREVYFLQDV